MLSLWEIISLVIMTVALGYIFTGYVRSDPYDFKRFSWKELKFSMIVAAPAVVLHEFGHKFVAMAFGHSATFFVYWWGLGLALILKVINSPLLILAPAYVSIPGGIPAFDAFWIALAGPLVNLILFLISMLVLKYKKKMKHIEMVGWTISKRLNLFLFIFNMIPIPPLDGSHVLSNLLAMF
ncbi:M50 family metallopeptidase [archaeon]|jgi:Zn-dependent protease|nr:M50 family metallopeptidase [archaeon]MBT4441059.1 M50 family metallopeptidase [archaeon]